MELDKEEEMATMENNGVKVKKICKNCKYYEKGEFYNHYGTCSNEKIEYNDFFSDIINKPEFAKDKLLYADYEGYNASVDVGEEFGCIHFKRGKR